MYTGAFQKDADVDNNDDLVPRPVRSGDGLRNRGLPPNAYDVAVIRPARDAEPIRPARGMYPHPLWSVRPSKDPRAGQ